MNNNLSVNVNPNFIRSSLPYSKTVVQHYPMNLFNSNFGQNYQNYFQNNLNNISQKFGDNSIKNNNMNCNFFTEKTFYNGKLTMNNINNINNLNNNNLQDQVYKRNESRRKTCPSFNSIHQDLSKIQNFNKINNQMIGNYNQLLYQNNNIIEYLIFQLKFNLEKTGKIYYYIYGLIKGKFLNIIKNHKGSKIFQKYLKSTHSDILHQIFVELSSNLEELITDSYANYFCKRFFTFLNQKD